MNAHFDEFARQRALDTYHVVDSLPDLAFDDITRLASLLCDTPIALISLIDRDRQWFKSHTGMEAGEGRRDEAFCNHVIQAPDRLMEVRDATADPRFADNPYVTGGDAIRFYAGMPLVTPGGAPIGTVCVLDRRARGLTDDQRAGLASLARLTMNLLEARHRERELERAAFLAATVSPDSAPARPVAQSAKPAAPDTSGYTIAIFEVQGLAAATKRIGHRAVERALAQLQEALEASFRPGSGDTVSHASDSPEMIVVLHGKDTAQALKALADILPGYEGETSFRVLWASSDATSADERPELVFLRAEAALSDAKDRSRAQIAAQAA